MLYVWLKLLSAGRKIEMFSGEVALDRATYNWPCVKTGLERKIPTFCTN
jgi:hypothetical protein